MKGVSPIQQGYDLYGHYTVICIVLYMGITYYMQKEKYGIYTLCLKKDVSKPANLGALHRHREPALRHGL